MFSTECKSREVGSWAPADGLGSLPAELAAVQLFEQAFGQGTTVLPPPHDLASSRGSV